MSKTMKLSSFSASFKDYLLELDYYHGKDIVHQGCLLKLDSKYSWERINGKVRNKVRKAQKLNARIVRVKGTAADIKKFRSIWFDPDDDTLPSKLGTDEIMYLCYLKDELVGGLILTPSSKTTLYMHNLGASEEGKRNNIPALLLWHAVEDLEKSEYMFIDVGVSFRPALYNFFKNWQTDSYPIIFNPPFIAPDIRLTPFSGKDLPTYTGSTSKEAWQTVSNYFGKDFTILPRAIHCLQAVLKYLQLKKLDEVAIFKTFDNNYISRCVTDPIEHTAKVSRKITAKTKAVVVIHEFGFPYKDILHLKQECEKRGIPLIEDCAWSIGTKIDSKHTIGEVGDYAIFSLPKVFALPFGGILKGLSISDEDNWSNYRLLDHFKRELVVEKLNTYLPKLNDDNIKRQENWHYLADLFKQDGFDTFAVLEKDVYPGAFVVALDNFQDVFHRYEEFGIEAGRYYPGKSLFLPIHQSLSKAELDYIYAVFRGLLNLCLDYKRG